MVKESAVKFLNFIDITPFFLQESKYKTFLKHRLIIIYLDFHLNTVRDLANFQLVCRV